MFLFVTLGVISQLVILDGLAFPMCPTLSPKVLGSQARLNLQSPLPSGLFWNAQRSPHCTAAAKGSCCKHWSPPEPSY